jgi:CRP-like cAMP-binding protein
MTSLDTRTIDLRPASGSAPSSDALYGAACLDCPAARQNVFADLVGAAPGACAFSRLSLEARAPIPGRWFGTYMIGLIRRGVLIRQRVDSLGRATAIDAAGPGCLIPLGAALGTVAVGGYAATRVLVCVCPTEVIARGVRAGDPTAPDLIRLQSEALERVERIADARGRATVDERVAALLIALSETLAPPRSDVVIPSGLQQRDMAALLGVRHESVCRSIRKLESRGLIAREPEGLRIADRAALQAA